MENTVIRTEKLELVCPVALKDKLTDEYTYGRIE